jgi:hypothetical protein
MKRASGDRLVGFFSRLRRWNVASHRSDDRVGDRQRHTCLHLKQVAPISPLAQASAAFHFTDLPVAMPHSSAVSNWATVMSMPKPGHSNPFTFAQMPDHRMPLVDKIMLKIDIHHEQINPLREERDQKRK